ncbi:MAG TPA: hypothetical protein VET23_02855 [Chitinophagaceae bacterium]|nr:hypothetical protein [Chitinophagaceae bacterium]
MNPKLKGKPYTNRPKQTRDAICPKPSSTQYLQPQLDKWNDKYELMKESNLNKHTLFNRERIEWFFAPPGRTILYRRTRLQERRKMIGLMVLLIQIGLYLYRVQVLF